MLVAIAMLVMAYGVSSARHLDELPVAVEPKVSAAGVTASGSTKGAANGCLTVGDKGTVETCGDMGKGGGPMKGSLEQPVELTGQSP
ncbi:Glycogen phosphorylase [Bienertia sinuspersici]